MSKKAREKKMETAVKSSEKPITYTCIVLDQSGSMANTKEDVIQNYNEQVQQMKLNAKNQDIYGSLITFNGDVFEHVWNEKAELIKEVENPDDYDPNGSTAMRDALGYAIEKLLATTDSKNPNISYLVVVISDGRTNADKHYRGIEGISALREMVESVQRTGRWTIAYMGCSEDDVYRVARETSIPISNMAVWSNKTKSLAAHGLHENRKKLGEYYTARVSGQSASNNVYSDQVDLCANFTDKSVKAVVNELEIPAITTDPNVNLDYWIERAKIALVNNVNDKYEWSGKPFTNHNAVKWDRQVGESTTTRGVKNLALNK